jgi:hypothetical protein
MQDYDGELEIIQVHELYEEIRFELKKMKHYQRKVRDYWQAGMLFLMNRILSFFLSFFFFFYILIHSLVAKPNYFLRNWLPVSVGTAACAYALYKGYCSFDQIREGFYDFVETGWNFFNNHVRV